MTTRILALAICLGLPSASASAQSPDRSSASLLARAQQAPQPTAPLTLEAYQWAQQHDRAVQNQKGARTWMVMGGISAGAGLVLGSLAPSEGRGIMMLLMAAPGAAVGGFAYRGYRNAQREIRDLEARRPTTSTLAFGSDRHAFVVAPHALGYRFSW